MKKFIKAVLLALLSLGSSIAVAEYDAIMMDKVDDPAAGMASILGAENVALAQSMVGALGQAVEYKHCIQNISEESFKQLGEALIEEVAEGGKFNDTKSINWVDECPLPANGSCDHGSRIEYFYTTSDDLLNDQREGCEYFQKKWTSFDASKSSEK